MLNLHPSRDLVYVVLKPIPDPTHPGKTLAEPGDEVIVRAHDEDWPITVVGRLPIESSVLFPDNAVKLLASYEPTSVKHLASSFCEPMSGDQPSEQRDPSLETRRLRLLG